MQTLDSILTINLARTADGTIRIGKTRVALESVVHHFSLGATAEEIAQKFPSLTLAEVYGTISYFLENHESVARYVLQQEADGDRIGAECEAKFQSANAALREKLLTRWKHRQTTLQP